MFANLTFVIKKKQNEYLEEGQRNREIYSKGEFYFR